MAHMLIGLQQMQNAAEKEMAAFKSLLADAKPNGSAIAASRLRMAKLARQRFDYIDSRIKPRICLQSNPETDASLTTALAMVRHLMAEFSEFITEWPIHRIMTEWDTYRTHSLAFVVKIETWIGEDEKRLSALLVTANRSSGAKAAARS